MYADIARLLLTEQFSMKKETPGIKTQPPFES